MIEASLIRFDEASDTMKAVGIKDNPLVVSADVIDKVTRKETANKKGHEISENTILALPELISNPIMILNSDTVDNSVVIVTDTRDNKGRAVIIAVHLNRHEGFNEVNRISSVYGKDNELDFFVEQIDIRDNLLGYDKKKANQLLHSRGLQLPKENITVDSELKLPQDWVTVNTIISENADNDTKYSLSATSKKALDAEYMQAVEKGDTETARRLVDEAAKAAGYTNDESWKMQHRAPNHIYDVSLFDVKNANLVPNDYLSEPRKYIYNSQEEIESHNKVTGALKRAEEAIAEGRPADKIGIRVYRAVDKTKNVREDWFRNGDWVTPSRAYAEREGRMNPNGYRIISHFARVKDLYWDGNSISELGYDDGKNYVYADTLNNRKQLDAVTYDHEGNVIPLSKRFNKRDFDTKYSRTSDKWQEHLDENYAPEGTGKSISDVTSLKPENKKPKTEPTIVTETGIEFNMPLKDYPQEKQKLIGEYLSSVDESVRQAAEEYKSNKNAAFKRVYISAVSEKQASDIHEIFGGDYSRYDNFINKNAFNHIEKEHGENGVKDNTMSNLSDIARVG